MDSSLLAMGFDIATPGAEKRITRAAVGARLFSVVSSLYVHLLSVWKQVTAARWTSLLICGACLERNGRNTCLLQARGATLRKDSEKSTLRLDEVSGERTETLMPVNAATCCAL